MPQQNVTWVYLKGITNELAELLIFHSPVPIDITLVDV